MHAKEKNIGIIPPLKIEIKLFFKGKAYLVCRFNLALDLGFLKITNIYLELNI